MISDDFSISLLNPESELYKYKADKYENMVSHALLYVIGYAYICKSIHTYFFRQKKIIIIFFIYFSELEQTYVYYDPQDKGSISKMFWDYIQTNLGCCGAESK